MTSLQMDKMAEMFGEQLKEQMNDKVAPASYLQGMGMIVLAQEVVSTFLQKEIEKKEALEKENEQLRAQLQALEQQQEVMMEEPQQTPQQEEIPQETEPMIQKTTIKHYREMLLFLQQQELLQQSHLYTRIQNYQKDSTTLQYILHTPSKNRLLKYYNPNDNQQNAIKKKGKTPYYEKVPAASPRTRVDKPAKKDKLLKVIAFPLIPSIERLIESKVMKV